MTRALKRNIQKVKKLGKITVCYFTKLSNWLLVIWQLPQVILGVFVIGFHFICGHVPEVCTSSYGYTYLRCKHINNKAVSLYFISIDSDKPAYINTLNHEYGHKLQSIYLGWLYIPTIGLPSFVFNVIAKVFKWDDKKYYSLPWEEWADRLGGVNR